MNILAWFLLCFFLVGTHSQTLAPTISITTSISISNTNSITNSVTNSVTNTVSNTNSHSNSNSNSNSYSVTTSTSYTNSFTLSNSVTTSYSPSVTISGSQSISYSSSQNLYSTPYFFESSRRSNKRPQNIQCKYANPNLYCRWQPGRIGYKRIRLQVVCNSTNTFFVGGTQQYEYYAVYNTSTPHYRRGTPPGSQQTTLVSLDLPPLMSCQGILTVRMFSNRLKGGKFDNTTGVTYTRSRYWYTAKSTAGVFPTAKSLLAF